MSESSTPICDLIERLLSTGLSTADVMGAARPTEAALLRTTTARASTPGDRQKWKNQKKRQRGASTALSTLGLDSDDQESNGRKRKKEPAVDISADGWPADFVETFWTSFPPYRRQAKAKVAAKLAKIRSAGLVAWLTVIGGVHRFAETQPGEYAPAPMVWLNEGRWDREYGPQQQGAKNGQPTARTGFSGIAAGLRQRVDAAAERELQDRGERPGGPEQGR